MARTSAPGSGSTWKRAIAAALRDAWMGVFVWIVYRLTLGPLDAIDGAELSMFWGIVLGCSLIFRVRPTSRVGLAFVFGFFAIGIIAGFTVKAVAETFAACDGSPLIPGITAWVLMAALHGIVRSLFSTNGRAEPPTAQPAK